MDCGKSRYAQATTLVGILFTLTRIGQCVLVARHCIQNATTTLSKARADGQLFAAEIAYWKENATRRET